MTHPDLPDGYYLAEQEGWSHAIFRHVTQYGESHWRDSIDQRMPDPRTLDYVLTPVSAITAMKAEAAQVWQPIETSPRTNRARLVYCPERKNIHLVAWEDSDCAFNQNADCWRHFGGGALLREAATHWMPLPPNPEMDTQWP